MTKYTLTLTKNVDGKEFTFSHDFYNQDWRYSEYTGALYEVIIPYFVREVEKQSNESNEV